nr:MAG TPA: hypothetical protein [Caudoviricetes sp.]
MIYGANISLFDDIANFKTDLYCHMTIFNLYRQIYGHVNRPN